MHQLAVIDGATPEGRFGHIGLTAIVGDQAEDRVVFHRAGIWDKRVGRGKSQGVLASSAHPWEMRALNPWTAIRNKSMDALSAIAKSASDEAVPAACYTGLDRFVGSQWRGGRISEASFMRRSSLKLALVLAALWVPA